MIVCDHLKFVNDKGAVSRSRLLRLVMLADSGFHQRAFWLMPFENLEADDIDEALTSDLKAAFNYALTSSSQATRSPILRARRCKRQDRKSTRLNSSH